MEIEEIVKLIMLVVAILIGVGFLMWFSGGDFFGAIKSAMRLGG